MCVRTRWKHSHLCGFPPVQLQQTSSSQSIRPSGETSITNTTTSSKHWPGKQGEMFRVLSFEQITLFTRLLLVQWGGGHRGGSTRATDAGGCIGAGTSLPSYGSTSSSLLSAISPQFPLVDGSNSANSYNGCSRSREETARPTLAASPIPRLLPVIRTSALQQHCIYT